MQTEGIVFRHVIFLFFFFKNKMRLVQLLYIRLGLGCNHICLTIIILPVAASRCCVVCLLAGREASPVDAYLESLVKKKKIYILEKIFSHAHATQVHTDSNNKEIRKKAVKKKNKNSHVFSILYDSRSSISSCFHIEFVLSLKMQCVKIGHLFKEYGEACHQIKHKLLLTKLFAVAI